METLPYHIWISTKLCLDIFWLLLCYCIYKTFVISLIWYIRFKLQMQHTPTFIIRYIAKLSSKHFYLLLLLVATIYLQHATALHFFIKKQLDAFRWETVYWVNCNIYINTEIYSKILEQLRQLRQWDQNDPETLVLYWLFSEWLFPKI